MKLRKKTPFSAVNYGGVSRHSVEGKLQNVMQQNSSLSSLQKGASIYDVRSGWGRGSPKSRRREQNQLFFYSDKGGGGQTIQIFCGRHIWKPPKDGARAAARGVKLISAGGEICPCEWAYFRSERTSYSMDYFWSLREIRDLQTCGKSIDRVGFSCLLLKQRGLA